MDGLEQNYQGRIQFMRLNFNSTEGQALAQRFQVRGHPTIVLVDREATAQATIVGVPTRERLEQEILRVMAEGVLRYHVAPPA